MKDNILCIFIMLFVSVTFNANAQKSPQGQFSVKGVLVDSLSNEGEPYWQCSKSDYTQNNYQDRDYC